MYRSENFWKQIRTLIHYLMVNNQKKEKEGPTPTEEVQLLFVRNENAIRAFIRALQPSLSDADDVLQETFLTVSRKASSFEIGTNFTAWACGIARLKVLENFRQTKRANVLSEKAIIALTEDVPSPESFKEREQALEKCIAKLPSKLRDLLWRRYSRRQSSDEMAEALGMTSNAVRVALSRSRMSLRDCINLQLKKTKGI